MKNRRKRILILISITVVALASTTFIFSFLESNSSTNTFYIHIHPYMGKELRSLPEPQPPPFLRKEREVDEIRKFWNGQILHASEWGEQVSGVKNRLNTDQKVLALTFDACGGSHGSGYDEELINFLRKERIPATLFINARWIQKNKDTFVELSKDELFTIENHGSDHLPLSIHGNSAWGIPGTSSADEVIDEVMENQRLIFEITGKTPSFFRSGTAFYDEVAVQIVQDLGLTVVNFDILGDAGATFSADQVTNALLGTTTGSIALLHMNQPNGGTAEGVMAAVPQLLEMGFKFVHLSDFELQE